MPELRKNFSRQRELIYEQVKNHPVHPTADEVYSALKKDCPNLSLGTVYRNLNLLSKSGMLLKIHIGGGKDRFDGRTDAHCHFLCEVCGRVFDVDDENIHGVKQRVLEKDGHRVETIAVSLKGVCRECCNARKRTTDN